MPIVLKKGAMSVKSGDEMKELDIIAGIKGDRGDPGQDGSPGSPGSPGRDGVSVTHSWSGTTLNVTSASGTSSADLKGEKGDKGDPGKDGSDANVTAQNIESALGYKPLENVPSSVTDQIQQNTDDIAEHTQTISEIERNVEGKADRSEIPDISGKQDTITDLETIRGGAAKGATALQNAPVTSVNGMTGDVMVHGGGAEKEWTLKGVITASGNISVDFSDCTEFYVKGWVTGSANGLLSANIGWLAYNLVVNGTRVYLAHWKDAAYGLSSVRCIYGTNKTANSASSSLAATSFFDGKKTANITTLSISNVTEANLEIYAR